MIKDFFVSFSDNLKEKNKNPFLGTYLLVWLIRNWKLIYTLFNFDDKTTLVNKVKFIDDYYSRMDFMDNLFQNILWSFGLLIVTYFLLNISRLIVNISEKRITPWIYKITDSKSIVLRGEYDRLRTDNDELQVRLDKERESKSRLESRIKNLEEEIINVSNIHSEGMTETDGEYLENIEDSHLEKIYQKLKQRNLVREFLNICVQINKNEIIYLSMYEGIDYFIQQGLLVSQRSYDNERSTFRITSDGNELLKMARVEDENDY
jgi:hypothetical protein